MRKEIEAFFEKEKIEYFSAIPYRECKEINPEIMSREDFAPQSVIVFLLPYYTGETKNLSRYAASLDYHIIIKEVTIRLTELLGVLYPSNRFRGYGDHSPINECHAAISSGLGILGDNGLIINEKYGSYVFVADIVTDIPSKEFGCIKPLPIGFCEHCGACKRACPTGILRGEGGDCLSAITQRKGDLTECEISLMKECDTVWGCDECQSSCPHNKNAALTPIEFFYKDKIDFLTSDVLSKMDKTVFMKRAFAWRGRKTVERNLKKLGY